MDNKELFTKFINKATLKQEVYKKGLEALEHFRAAGHHLLKEYKATNDPRVREIPVQIHSVGNFEFRIRFAGDIAVFLMHSNVFAFPKSHPVHNVPYIQEDPERAYFSQISIYNFLNDSFKYNRINDYGHLIDRIFINKDMHYFLDTQNLQQAGFPLVSQSVFDRNKAEEIIKAVINHVVDYDLYVPPTSYVEHIKLSNIIERTKHLSTSKRLGFKFKNQLKR